MTTGTLTVRERDLMYRLMISQMLHDGHHEIAGQLSKAVYAFPDCPPSNRLQHVVQLGLRAEPDREVQVQLVDSVAPGTGIDLEFDTDVQTLAPEAAHYETCYVTSHKAPCRVAAWSKDGQLVATGSDDASIKILDVERMLAKSATNMPESQHNVDSHPVIRTLYDHIEDVTALDFHPSLPLLASGSKDFTIKFFDFSKSGVKRAFRSLQEAEEISCLNFHPGGNFLLVGTQHPTLRLYDVTTLQCYVSSNPKDQHTGPVRAVTYSPNASIYASASQDGSIKIWDGISNRCVNTLEKAHSGTDVCSVQFSRNSKYLLSSGKDCLVKLWEVSTSRVLITYTGASSDKQVHETRAVFNHSEDYVFFPDEKTTSLCCWDSRNAERNKLLSLGHNNIVRCIVHSPTGPGFMTCSDDFRARFWYYRPSSD
ncbi:cleavage stimulation factor subunit 1-like isoform X1 [Patiria miniata]|uniref:Cleavage stimulation factor 50 kDa subunit n=2 Tax=Patiria miniata TaxID=46514 RepID=A0A914AC86_PATMI|nr:cleavage stimulation factor subunit 1-like isoform X1 [Patiria miniata]